MTTTRHEHTQAECDKWNNRVPGSWYGSNWDWVPCQTHQPEPHPTKPGEISIELRPR